MELYIHIPSNTNIIVAVFCKTDCHKCRTGCVCEISAKMTKLFYENITVIRGLFPAIIRD